MQISCVLRKKKTLVHSTKELIDYLSTLTQEDFNFVEFNADERTLQRISSIIEEWSIGKECIYV